MGSEEYSDECGGPLKPRKFYAILDVHTKDKNNPSGMRVFQADEGGIPKDKDGNIGEETGWYMELVPDKVASRLRKESKILEETADFLEKGLGKVAGR